MVQSINARTIAHATGNPLSAPGRSRIPHQRHGRSTRCQRSQSHAAVGPQNPSRYPIVLSGYSREGVECVRRDNSAVSRAGCNDVGLPHRSAAEGWAGGWGRGMQTAWSPRTRRAGSWLSRRPRPLRRYYPLTVRARTLSPLCSQLYAGPECSSIWCSEHGSEARANIACVAAVSNADMLLLSGTGGGSI